MVIPLSRPQNAEQVRDALTLILTDRFHCSSEQLQAVTSFEKLVEHGSDEMKRTAVVLACLHVEGYVRVWLGKTEIDLTSGQIPDPLTLDRLVELVCKALAIPGPYESRRA